GAGRMLAQDCPAIGRIQPGSFASGTLDSASCRLSDGSAYYPYRLDLPVRGQIRLEFNAPGKLMLTLHDSCGAHVCSRTTTPRPIEGGSYPLLVNAASKDEAGSYQITASFTAEPSIPCTGFPSIGTTDSVQANLGSFGCRAPDGSPYDAYSLATAGGGQLT